MAKDKATLLIVDDDVQQLNVITSFLKQTDYQIDVAHDGKEAWETLEKNPQRYTTILLDRVMPEMSGIDVLKKMKKHKMLKMIPVVMQTGLSTKENIMEGLAAGAFCYLAKPYRKEMLLAVVKTAVTEGLTIKSFQEEMDKAIDTLGLMDQAHFSFKSIQEGYDIAKLLSRNCPNPEKVALGLSELFTNAIEHGNLGISYAEKTELLTQGVWMEEVNRRLKDPQYASKTASLSYERTLKQIAFLIIDEGVGFEWEPYLDFDQDRAFDIHGRGIAIAKHTSFDQIEYRGKGNEVFVTIKLG